MRRLLRVSAAVLLLAWCAVAQAALPTVVINGSGSDTSSSGAGPATALSGVGASTNATTTVTLLADNPNLSGVAVDGSAALWIGSTSGRRWSKITAVNNTAGVKTVTVESAYTLTESGKNWGIGGKRLSLAGSLQLGLDAIGGWTIDVQTDQVLTANFRLSPTAVAGVWTTFTSTTGTRPVISTATASIYGLDIQGANNLVVSHLSFLCTATTKGNGIAPVSNVAANSVLVSDCVLDGWAVGIQDHDNGNNVDVFGMIIEGCEIKNCTGHGITTWAGCQLSGVYAHNNAGSGLFSTSTRVRGFSLSNCIFDSNTLDQVSITPPAQVGVVIRHCSFTNAPATRNGLSVNTTSGTPTLDVANSIFYGNASNGITASGGNSVVPLLRNNAFGSNGTNVAGFLVNTGANPITLTASPFVSPTDFTLNGTAGGGALLRGAAATIPNAAPFTGQDVGAVQHRSPGQAR